MNDNLLTATIMETLGRNGALEKDDLCKQVQKIHGGIEERSFERILMRMEIRGFHANNLDASWFSDILETNQNDRFFGTADSLAK